MGDMYQDLNHDIRFFQELQIAREIVRDIRILGEYELQEEHHSPEDNRYKFRFDGVGIPGQYQRSIRRVPGITYSGTLQLSDRILMLVAQERDAANFLRNVDADIVLAHDGNIYTGREPLARVSGSHHDVDAFTAEVDTIKSTVPSALQERLEFSWIEESRLDMLVAEFSVRDFSSVDPQQLTDWLNTYRSFGQKSYAE